MSDGFHAGKIFGIEININPTWIFIFLLVTLNLAVGVFPRFHPEWGIFLNWGLALIASFLFFSSVLAHEIAHSLVARARGLPVNSITLFLFGGSSNLEREPSSPGTEFIMAVVGPVTSIVLGFIFLFIAGSTAGVTGSFVTGNDPENVFSRLNPLSTMLIWLGSVNILLGIFNLIPGFPLDGGRILRSIIWAFTNNFKKATLYASVAGQVIAWMFIFIGISMILGIEVPFFGSGFIGGFWLVFIGWFLNNAASYSYQKVLIKEELEKVPVSKIMRTNVSTVTQNISIKDLIYDYIMGTDRHAFAVMYNNRLVGFVSLEDVRKVSNDDWDKTKVSEIMTSISDLDVVNPKEDASEALDKLLSRDVGQLPVVKDGTLVGMLDRRDLLLWLQLQMKKQI